MKTTQSGMTVTEILFTLAVVGVLTAIALPSMSSFAENSQVAADSNSFLNALQLARSESATRNSRISLCKIAPADSTTCANGESWEAGWIVFEDANLDGARNAGEQIFTTTLGMGPNTAVSTTDYATTISFLPSGSVSSNGSLNICVNGNVANTILINATGRARIVESSCP